MASQVHPADRRRSRLVAAGLSLALIAVLTGCGGSAGTYAQLSKSAASAGSPVRSASLALHLEAAGSSLASETDTSIQDAIAKVDAVDSSLATMSLTGAEKSARDAVLADVRKAEDALLVARAKLSTSRAKYLSASATALAKAAKRLQTLSDELERRA
ncbi:MAG: hypothetical protein QOF79_1055 [Actinomycetota bacterium]|jgi:amino acid transporter|nr:hypothetical protein [Actinomycetota bacterium]